MWSCWPARDWSLDLSDQLRGCSIGCTWAENVFEALMCFFTVSRSTERLILSYDHSPLTKLILCSYLVPCYYIINYCYRSSYYQSVYHVIIAYRVIWNGTYTSTYKGRARDRDNTTPIYLSDHFPSKSVYFRVEALSNSNTKEYLKQHRDVGINIVYKLLLFSQRHSWEKPTTRVHREAEASFSTIYRIFSPHSIAYLGGVQVENVCQEILILFCHNRPKYICRFLPSK